MKIKKLPSEARSKIESGIVITDAVQCVLELVHNSLDAQATAIAVRIDLKNCQIQVVDNGKGMSKNDMKLIGERFVSSKYHHLNDTDSSELPYGFRGQAISSLIDACKSLKIETKCDENGPSFIKVFQNGKPLPIIRNEYEKTETGTMVTVEDFLCTMPVRRKRIDKVFNLDEIKVQLQYLAVIHYNVSFTLRNETKGLILLQTLPSSGLLKSVESLFGKALTKHLKPLNLKCKNYDISGFVSIKSQRQSLQLFYLNKRLITKGVIHKFVNSLLKEYFGTTKFFDDSLSDKVATFKKFNYSFQSVFVLVIKCPRSQFEFFSNLRKSTVEFKNWNEILKYIHKAIRNAVKMYRSLESTDDEVNHSSKNESGEIDKKDCASIEEIKSKFGTSLLLNAVRGAPVKKKGVNLQNKKAKKSRTEKSIKLNDSNLNKVKKYSEDSSVERNLNVTHDSMESPIPKKNFELLPQPQQQPSATPTILQPDQSFLQFYKWLKGKFEADSTAYHLYSDFLQAKNKKNFTVNETAAAKSPVFQMGPAKRKKLIDANNAEAKHFGSKMSSIDLTYSKPESIKKKASERGVQTSPNDEIKIGTNEHFVMKCENVRDANREEKIFEEIFKKPNMSFLSRKRKRVKLQSTFTTPSSSEMFFSNLIEFRNMPENINYQPPYPPKSHESDNIIHTWTSHYQRNHISPNSFLHSSENDVEKCFYNSESLRNETATLQNLEGGLNLSYGTEVYTKNVEVQANISRVNQSIQTSNAVVQTEIMEIVLNSSNLTEDNVTAEKSTCNKNILPNIQTFDDDEKVNQGQEVPSRDLLAATESDNVQRSFSCSKTPKPENSILNDEKVSRSSDFCCGQKSNTQTKQANSDNSESKESKTLNAMWTQCLEGIENAESLNLESLNFPNSTELPKTIPVEELKSDPKHVEFFCLTERYDVVPKGLSPKLSESTKFSSLTSLEKLRIGNNIDGLENKLLANVKWLNETTGESTKPSGITNGIFDEMLRKAGENFTYGESEILSASLSYSAIKVHHLLHSFSLTKDLLSKGKVLGQLDKKFIVAQMKVYVPKKMKIIVVFDQHAVDERIKLEEIINGYVKLDGKFISFSLNSPIEFVLDVLTVEIASNFEEKLTDFGFKIKVKDESTITVQEIPKFLLHKIEKNWKTNEDNKLKDDALALILTLIEEMMETKGAISKMPKIIHDWFCSQACHSAIKFNQVLDYETMNEMIMKLKNCKLPFQCAHGRPSVVPIIDLYDLDSVMKEDERVDRRKLIALIKKQNPSDDFIENSN